MTPSESDVITAARSLEINLYDSVPTIKSVADAIEFQMVLVDHLASLNKVLMPFLYHGRM